MNTKKMIAAFAILMMAFVAVAAVPVAVDDAADAKEIVYMNGDVTSALGSTSEQKVIIDKDMTVKEGGSVEILGELLVNEGVKVVIETGGSFTINGDAIINGSITSKGSSGLTINISDFENVVINGTVSAMGDTSGEFITSVAITAAGTDDCKVLVNGTLYVGTNAYMTVNGVEIASQGKLAVYGAIQGPLKLAGYAYFESDDVNGPNNVYINFTDASAVVDIKAVSGGITISDADMYAYSYGGVQYYVGCSAVTELKQKALAYDADAEVGDQFTDVALNSITLSNIKNVKITEKVATATAYDESDSTTKMYAETKMIIAPLDAAASVEAADSAIVGFRDSQISMDSGETIYFETMNIYGVPVSIDAEATVSGTITYPLQPNSETFAVTNHGTLNVDGKVEILRDSEAGGIENYGVINAAYYKVLNTDDNTYNHYYTTVQQAIDNGVKDIKTLGVLIIEKDTTVPADVKITTSEIDGTTLIVKEGATFKFVDQSKFVLNGDAVIEGVLIFENIDFGITLGDNDIFADVMKKTDAKVEFMNIYVAFAAAVAGDELQAYNPVDETIVIDKDLILPAGVTFYNVNENESDGAEKTVQVDNGATFTIAGKLLIKKGDSLCTNSANGWNDKTPAVDSQTGEVKDYSVLVIGANGMIVFESTSPSEGVYGGHVVAGAYFTITDDETQYYITNIAYAFDNILDADSYSVEIAKKNTIENLKVTGTEKERIIVKFIDGSETTFKGFTFAYGQVQFFMGSEEAVTTVTGDIGTATGKMTFDEALINNGLAIFEDRYVNDAMNLTVRGIISSEKETTVSGTVFFDNFGYNALGDNESVRDFEDMRLTVEAGAKLFIIGERVSIVDAEVYILGDVIVTNTGSFFGNPASVVSVIGTMTVEKLDGKSGKANFYRYVVGGSSNDLFTYERPDTVGTAVLGGQGTFNDTAKPFVLIVASGATVSADVLVDWMAADSTKNTQFYIDEKLWATVYVPAAVVTTPAAGVAIMTTTDDEVPVTYPNIVPTLDNVKFGGWQTYDEKTKTYTTITPAKGETVWVGQSGYDKVYADLTKDIYTIRVTADVGIDNVYIDGKIMIKYNNYNVFGAEVAAGTHTITYELANGYTGNAYITTIDGKAIVGSGLTFKVSDDNYDETKHFMDITISGIQKSGYDTDPETHPEKSTGLTVTEILLIVVVIIMAIMAVVLILRLNRS